MKISLESRYSVCYFFEGYSYLAYWNWPTFLSRSISAYGKNERKDMNTLHFEREDSPQALKASVLFSKRLSDANCLIYMCTLCPIARQTRHARPERGQFSSEHDMPSHWSDHSNSEFVHEISKLPMIYGDMHENCIGFGVRGRGARGALRVR